MKSYPLREGGVGRLSTVVAGLATVFVVGFASISPPFSSKVTV
jgi:hypothetical protein